MYGLLLLTPILNDMLTPKIWCQPSKQKQRVLYNSHLFQQFHHCHHLLKLLSVPELPTVPELPPVPSSPNAIATQAEGDPSPAEGAFLSPGGILNNTKLDGYFN